MDGKKGEAAAAVPDKLVEVELCGSADRIKGLLERWVDAGKKHHIGSMLLGAGQPEALRIVAEAVL